MANSHSLDLERSSNQYAEITDASQTGLDITGDFTFEFWIKLEQLPTTAGAIMTLLSKWDNADTPNKAYSLWLHSDDTLISRYEDGTPGETQTKSDSAFVVAGDVGNWVHIAVTADVSAATIVMYKNGSVISSTNADSRSTSITNGNAEFRIGSRNDAGAALDTLDGLIDEVRVWNDIRTPTEIADNKDKELIGTEANLQGYWKFNNDYTDETSNGNDLTASGSPVFSTDVPFVGETPTASPIAHILQMI